MKFQDPCRVEPGQLPLPLLLQAGALGLGFDPVELSLLFFPGALQFTGDQGALPLKINAGLVRFNPFP